MAARKNRRNNKQKQSLPWGPMLISFMVGGFIMFLVHLKDNVPVDTASQTAKATEIKPKVIEPTFDFYTLLPEMEVVVDVPKQSKKTIVTSPPEPQIAQPKTSSKIEDNTSYLLQVGSFRKAEDADAYKAKLAFLGLESKVQTVTIDNKDTWHRVHVGPILGRDKADAVQKQLKQNDIDSLLMRSKKS